MNRWHPLMMRTQSLIRSRLQILPLMRDVWNLQSLVRSAGPDALAYSM